MQRNIRAVSRGLSAAALLLAAAWPLLAQTVSPAPASGGAGTPSGAVNDLQTNAGGGNFGHLTPGAGVATALAAAASGSGSIALTVSPTFVTPTLGAATATSINKWFLTAPTTLATLTAGGDNLTYTMPSISATMVGRTTTDTLTNKTIDCNSNTCTNFPGGSSLTVTDGTHSVASTTTATFGQGFVVGGSAGSATVNTTTPDRTATVGDTILSTDMAGQVNLNGASQTETIPAISSTVFATGMGTVISNRHSTALTISSTPTIGGCASATTIYQYGFMALVSNGTSLDCVGFPGFGALSGGVTATGAGVATVVTNANLTGPVTSSGNATAIANAAITQVMVAPATLATGTSVSLTAPREYYVCTGTCTVTPPVPAAGYEFCVMNDDNVATVITLAALGSSARYEATARTSYGTAGTGTLVSGGAAADKVCIVGRDSTHYLTVSFNGTWTAN